MKKEIDRELNPSVYWKLRRKYLLSCSYCKPNRSENQKRHKLSGIKRRIDQLKGQRRKIKKKFSTTLSVI